MGRHSPSNDLCCSCGEPTNSNSVRMGNGFLVVLPRIRCCTAHSRERAGRAVKALNVSNKLQHENGRRFAAVLFRGAYSRRRGLTVRLHGRLIAGSSTLERGEIAMKPFIWCVVG